MRINSFRSDFYTFSLFRTASCACIALVTLGSLSAQATLISSGWDARHLLFRRGQTPYYQAQDPASTKQGYELWTTDGSAAGTKLVKDINSTITGGSGVSPGAHIEYGALGIFQGYEFYSGHELWVTDGTDNSASVGTKRIADIVSGIPGSSPRAFFRINGLVYFFAESVGLWSTDGTSAGTQAVAPTATIDPSSLRVAVVGSQAYFSSSSAGAGYELFRTDGSAAGTQQVVDLVAGTGSSSPRNLTAFGSRLLFTASNAQGENELYATQGTAAQTVRLTTGPNGTGMKPRGIVVVGATAFFTADNGLQGRELWKTDGAPSGTSMVLNIGTGDSLQFQSNNKPIGADLNGTLIFGATTNGGSRELWKSDGSSTGTQKILHNGNPVSCDEDFKGLGSRFVYYYGGGNLNRTNGTTVSTVATNVRDQTLWSFIGNATLSNKSLLFHVSGAWQVPEGLYRVDPGAYADSVGMGCVAVGAPPTLASADPVIGNVSSFQVDGAPALATGMLILGFSADPFAAATSGPAASCALYYDLSNVLLSQAFTTDAAGSATVNPNVIWSTAMIGVVLTAQAGITDPATAPFGLAFTNGINLSVGQ